MGSYEIGEEITFFPLMDEREEAATRTSKIKQRSLIDLFNSRKVRVGALSVLAIMIFMISFLPSFNNDKVYAYMSIDINPSFEVGIDNQLNVISLVPLNEEAEKLIDKLPDWEKKPFDKIVDAIVAESKVEGYVYPGKEILITTVINEEDKAIQTKLEAGIDDISTSYEDEEMVVNTIESDNETREKAQNQGISTGKYIELKEKANAPKERVKEPAKKQEQSDNSSLNNKADNETLTEDTNGNNQAVKEKLESETKVKLEDAKKKLKENSNSSIRNSNDKNEKKLSDINKNVHKQEKDALKNAEKKRENQKMNNKENRHDRNNWDYYEDRDDWDNWDEKDNRNSKENRGKSDKEKENLNKWNKDNRNKNDDDND
ncbi:hypothetical protein [Metabacillus litoralis]|uniref:anti-sigma-I factor RsgI family protein n=1 Tax=Metabacillus litoralis TaxID=152268 RepID=UPI001E338F34